MSRCAHEQSTFEMKKLPRCTRCKVEFNLVMSSYEKIDDLIWEWECPKCHKIVAKELLREEDKYGQDEVLSQKFGTKEKVRDYRGNGNTSATRGKRRKDQESYGKDR